MKQIDRARVYRFGDTVAMNTGDSEGYTPTIYINQEQVKQLAELLLDYAEDIRVNPFTVSRMGTIIVERDGTYKKE